MIIDIHTHAWPEKASIKARENLESSFKVKLVADPTTSTLLNFMDKNKIDISVICSVAIRAEQVPSINNWLFSIRSKRLKAFCALHPDFKLWREELKRIKGNADGIKFQPEFQNFYIDDEKIFPMYALIEELELPVIFHCGHELSGTRLIRSSPERMLRVRKQFPKLKIIAAHFGGFRMWDEVKKYLLGRDIYMDTAFFFGHLNKDEVKNFILKHPADRLLFGTDFPLVDQKKDLDFLKALDIPEELKARILAANAQVLLNI